MHLRQGNESGTQSIVSERCTATCIYYEVALRPCVLADTRNRAFYLFESSRAHHLNEIGIERKGERGMLANF